jgi:hypothetical protein
LGKKFHAEISAEILRFPPLPFIGRFWNRSHPSGTKKLLFGFALKGKGVGKTV